MPIRIDRASIPGIPINTKPAAPPSSARGELADSDVVANVILAAARMPHAEQRRLFAELKERAKRSSVAEQAESDSD